MVTIASTAMAELTAAFKGLRIRFSDHRGGLYNVRVVQELTAGGAGQSRGITGFGGSGAVSFTFLANGVFAYAPPDATRADVIAAIGRGIGRTAVHEFVHQMLPTTPIHDSRNARSYEYASAARAAQYYGAMECFRRVVALTKRYAPVTTSRRASARTRASRTSTHG